MTEAQQRLYNAIKSYIKVQGYSPTIRELGEMVGKKSPATIWSMLEILRKKELITYSKGKSRTIRILERV